MRARVLNCAALAAVWVLPAAGADNGDGISASRKLDGAITLAQWARVAKDPLALAATAQVILDLGGTMGTMDDPLAPAALLAEAEHLGGDLPEVHRLIADARADTPRGACRFPSGPDWVHPGWGVRLLYEAVGGEPASVGLRNAPDSVTDEARLGLWVYDSNWELVVDPVLNIARGYSGVVEWRVPATAVYFVVITNSSPVAAHYLPQHGNARADCPPPDPSTIGQLPSLPFRLEAAPSPIGCFDGGPSRPLLAMQRRAAGAVAADSPEVALCLV